MNNLEGQISQVTEEVKNLLLAKNADYGNAFHRLLEEYGAVVFLIHAFEKLYRLENLIITKSEAAFESIRDSVFDLIGYGILYLIAIDSAKEGQKHE